jgi:carbon monoxide dehydrogenase subunit G
VEVLAAIGLEATRVIEAPLDAVTKALTTPSSYVQWVPGLIGVIHQGNDKSFDCHVRFSVFNLNFKAERRVDDDGWMVFSTKSITLGNVTGRVKIAKIDSKTTSAIVKVDGTIRTFGLYRVANAFFDRGADVVAARLSAYLATLGED